MLQLNQYPALLLNADWQPVSVHPLSTMNWQDAIKAVFQEKVEVVKEYDYEIHSGHAAWRLPSVVVLKDYIKRDTVPTFNRYNIYLRDDFTCQYCGVKKRTQDLTFDHVVPRSMGGKTSWTNVVAACSPCNFKKAAKPLSKSGFRLMTAPREPSVWELYLRGRKLPQDHLHETWRDYLYWDSELEN